MALIVIFRAIGQVMHSKRQDVVLTTANIVRSQQDSFMILTSRSLSDVDNHPENFKDAYWEIDWLRVYPLDSEYQ